MRVSLINPRQEPSRHSFGSASRTNALRFGRRPLVRCPESPWRAGASVVSALARLFPGTVKHWVALGVLFQVCQSVGMDAASIPKPRVRIPYRAVQPAKGVFLVARKGMLDPRFRRSVILLVAHGPVGTMGVIVNRVTDVSLEDVLPQVEKPGRKARLHYGGPVGLDTLMFLIRSEEALEQSTHVMADVYFGGDKRTLEQLLEEEKGDHQLRLFAGHSGWAPGQLDQELGRGDWRLFRADAFTVFEKPLERIWPDFMDPPESQQEVAGWFRNGPGAEGGHQGDGR
jgi:putative transcriptional regulator